VSRVIKFRAWTGKRMLTIDPLERKGTLSDLVEDESWKVMQFTGLTDRNGVDVYESDVVRDHVGIGRVEWHERKAAFRVNYENGEAKWFIDYTLRGERESIEVIGNIYENSELLEAKP